MRPTAELFWMNLTGVTEMEMHQSYSYKIKQLKDKKLAETSYKILNNILPCNKLLFKWGKIETPLCPFCNEEESISHLLFYCSNAQQIWNYVHRALNLDITHDMVIFGTGLDIPSNYVFSIIIYYIYKEFLICSFEKKERKYVSIMCFKNYCMFRKNVYEKCKSAVWKDICNVLDILCNF